MGGFRAASALPSALGESAALAGLFDKRLLFVTGKGGVGKTSVALALGLAAAEAGRRTIVCEVSAAEHASRIFRRARVGFNEVELSDGLWTISIDPDRSLREYLELQLPVKAMSDMLYRSRIFSYLAAATPGLREMVTIGKIWELGLERRRSRGARRYDLVIVDSPATGHGIGFLQTPATFAELARVGPLAKQAGTIARQLTQPQRTGTVIVALPEEMPVNETAALERDLEEVGIAVDRIYMNALYPQRFDDSDAARLEAAEPGPGSDGEAAIAAALGIRRRSIGQRDQLERLEQMTATPITELPFIFDPELDRHSLATLAGRLQAG